MARRLVAGLTILLVAASSLACAGIGATKTLPIGDEAPNFGINVDTKTITLHDYRGHVTIICFWRST